MVLLAAAVRYRLPVVSINCVAMAIIVAHDSSSIDRATTAGVATNVGITMTRATATRLSALRSEKYSRCSDDEE